MNYFRISIVFILSILALLSCTAPDTSQQQSEFNYFSEKFADLRILRYQVPGFEDLSLQQKKELYYLYEAALSGRDIIYDQNGKYNLTVRKTLEAIVRDYKGDRESEPFKNFMVYAKRVWFSNGIHHHYGADKFVPSFSEAYFAGLVKSCAAENLPLKKGESVDTFISRLTPVLFDPEIAPKRINLDPGQDMVTASANNYYSGVTQKEVEAFYAGKIDKNDPHPVSYGLNSQLAKVNGKITERVWKVGGMYSPAIERIVYWLDKAAGVAENDLQKKVFEALIAYYKSGDLKQFDEYNKLWVSDTESMTDAVNGFIETYGDALGYRAAYESVVSFKDLEATKRIAAISKEAQWFEDHSPLIEEHKKKNVKGISAKVITVVVESGDAAPSTPIGINLPNANWIRKEYGSKSVNLGNVVYAYDESGKNNGLLEEFAYSPEEIERARQYGTLGDNLHTDMHEVIGHASGQINPGIGTPKQTLKNYSSTLEEARADLVALYYVMDQKLVEIGVMPSLETGKAVYDRYIRNGLMTQLARLEAGKNLEEAHMRNRQLVAKWAMEKGRSENVIERKTKAGKTYFVINDYEKLRTLFGQLLREIQRIKSEGDYQAGKDLVESYGVQVDHALHAEVLARYKKLDIAPYGGFIQPRLVPVMNGEEIVDVKIEYPDDFTEQMLEYGEKYSFLPVEN